MYSISDRDGFSRVLVGERDALPALVPSYVGHVNSCVLPAHQLASLLQSLAWLQYLNCNCCSQFAYHHVKHYSNYCISFCHTPPPPPSPDFSGMVEVRIGVPNITTNTFLICMHLIVLDQEYLNYYDWILVVQLRDTLWKYGPIVSLLLISDFLLKLLPECRK
jgi:hypothetical protein